MNALLVAAACFAVPAATAAVPVLSIADVPETQDTTYDNGAGAYLYTHNYFLSPARILADEFAVNQIGWIETPAALQDLSRYRAVILWDAPARIADQRGFEPHYADFTVIDDAAARRLVAFVERGGVLIVAGGVTCYGNGHARLGSADHRAGNKRKFFGYAGSPLAAVLPVEVPDAVTLVPFADAKQQPLAVGCVADDPLVRGLDFSQWPIGAYHKVQAKAGAEVLLATATGDPLVTRWRVKRGAVVCVTAAPRANNLVRDYRDPTWPGEAVLWDRCLRWGLNLKPASGYQETKLRARYQALVAPPPAVPLGATAQEYPYVVHALDSIIPPGLMSLTMKYYADLGFNNVVMQGTRLMQPGVEKFLEAYHAALTTNSLMAFLHPDLCVEARANNVDPKDYAQVTLPSGEFALHYGAPYPDPFSSQVVHYAVAAVDHFMPIVKDFPRLRGMFFDDEWAWVMGYRNPYEGHQGIGSYSPAANARYRKLTGEDPPPPVFRAPGYVAPENDPWLKWCILMRQDAYRDYNQAVADATRKHRRDFLLSNYPGGMEGNLDILIEEVYLDCWKESELEALERMDVRSNFREDISRTNHPVWALIGIFRMPEDKAIYPETLRLTAGVCLGGGAKGLILWNGVNLWAPYMQHPGRESLDREAARLGAYLKKFGPMFLQLEKKPAPVWVLSGWFWVNSFDNYFFLPPDKEHEADYPKERPWWPFQVSDLAGPAAMRAGLYVEFVTEKQLLSPALFRQQAVIVPGLLYCRQAVVEALEKYAAQGGKLYTDQSSAVKLKGARVLPLDLAAWHRDIAAGKRPIIQPTEARYQEQRAARERYVTAAIPVFQKEVADQLELPVLIDSADAAHSLMGNGDATYLFVYNSNIQQTNRFNVAVRGLGSQVYDIEAGQPLKASGGRFAVTLPPGGWKVFALTDQRLDRIVIEQAAVSGDTLRLEATTRAGKDPFRAAVPVRIMLRDKTGATVLYRATSRGALALDLPLGGSYRQPDTVEIEEMFTGRRATANVAGK